MAEENPFVKDYLLPVELVSGITAENRDLKRLTQTASL
jgi:hypothetical protein